MFSDQTSKVQLCSLGTYLQIVDSKDDVNVVKNVKVLAFK